MNSFHFFCFALFASVSVLSVDASAPKTRIEIVDAAQPQLATDSQGRVWLAFGRANKASTSPSHQNPTVHHGGGHGHGAAAQRPAGDIFVTRSNDGGMTFAPAVKVANVPNLMLGNRRGPRMAAFGDRVTVTVIGHELLALSSADGGRTWGEPVTINEVPTCAREGLHDLAMGPEGRLFVTWLDLRNGKMELWGADSSDGGRTWSRNEEIYRSPDKSICECCHPSALFDAQGNLAVMWRNSVAGARDMWMATRTKGAKQFSPARKLGEGTWTINACPMDGGRILALGDGKFGSVWQRAGEICFAPASGPEKIIGQGRQPVAAVQAGETFVVWQQGTDLVSMRLGSETSLAKRAENARFPVLMVAPDGRGALLAYEHGPAKGATSVNVERL
jgi:hypothetical protein